MSADSKKNRQILIQQVDEFLINNPTQIEQETSNLLSILSRFHDQGPPSRDASKSKEKKLSTINSIGSDDQQIQFLGKYKSSMIKFIESFNYQELQVKDMIERIKTFYTRQINEIDDLIKHIFETQRSKQLQNQMTKRDDHDIQRIQYKFGSFSQNFHDLQNQLKSISQEIYSLNSKGQKIQSQNTFRKHFNTTPTKKRPLDEDINRSGCKIAQKKYNQRTNINKIYRQIFNYY